MASRVRALSDGEMYTIRQLAHSRTAAARIVERARSVLLAYQGRHVPTITQERHLTPTAVRNWLTRFNRQGLARLQERSWPGRPAPSTPEQVSEVLATSLTTPQALGLPCASWRLDRLAASLQEVNGLPIKRSRMGELLLREGWCWRTQETWCGERVDPAFAETKGSSRRSRALVMGLDDTLERHRGAKIRAKGIDRDPVRSSHSHLVKASGLHWLSLMLLAPISWALPFLTVLAPSERLLMLVTDSSFAVTVSLWRLSRLAQPSGSITRLRLDAALYEPALPVRPAAWYRNVLPPLSMPSRLCGATCGPQPIFACHR